MGRATPDRAPARGVRKPGRSLVTRASALRLAARGLRAVRALAASASALRARLLAAARGAMAGRVSGDPRLALGRARTTLAVLLEAEGKLLDDDVCAPGGGLALGARLPNRSSSAACVAARWRDEEVVAKVFGESLDEAAAHAAEARLLLAAGPHPAIVSLLGATARAPRLLLFARARGGSLHDRLHNRPPPPAARRWAEAVGWGRDVASALSHMHSLRPPLVHRDVKAANVLLDLPACLTDAGLNQPSPVRAIDACASRAVASVLLDLPAAAEATGGGHGEAARVRRELPAPDGTDGAAQGAEAQTAAGGAGARGSADGARAAAGAPGARPRAPARAVGAVGGARLCDFGSATALPATPSDSLGVGTPGWMAPELLGADGARHAGCACDVYSLGCLLFELAARALPYAALGEAEMMGAAAAGRTPLDDAPLPADAPPALVALIRECLAFDAFARPHAAVVAERLERLRAELAAGAEGGVD